ncbi:MAG: YihY/virulence factor BrkB family protein [Methyloligellaceae bacterium]
MKLLRAYWDAIIRLHFDYGIPFAGAITFSLVLAFFPFLIFVTALAGLLGGAAAADQAVAQLFEAFPREVADTLAPEVRRVLGQPRGDLLTLGILLTLVISSSGVESLRTALNRAYRVEEDRSFWFRRLQSIVFVLGGAIAMLILGFSIVLAPVLWDLALRHFAWLAPYAQLFLKVRYGVATVVLAAVLFAMHFWLPAAKRRLVDVWPGVLHTMVLWLVAGTAYSEYLARYNYYTSTYAGLANVMIALMFFFVTAAIFVFGAELNRAFIEGENGIRKGAAAPGATVSSPKP